MCRVRRLLFVASFKHIGVSRADARGLQRRYTFDIFQRET